MKARQNPFSKFEALMERIVERPFAFIFPSKLEPAEVLSKLERAMVNNLILPGAGRRLAPNVYDIYLSIKDHQQLSPSLAFHESDWQQNLVEFARQRHYMLKTNPVLRVHSDSSLRAGVVRIDAELVDPKHMAGGEGGPATQALSAEQLAQLRAQLEVGQPSPDGSNAPSSPNFPPAPVNMSPSPSQIRQPTLPRAWLTIRSAHAAEQTFRIEKQAVNIGRQVNNDIIVEDKQVSRYHAQIKYQQDGQFGIFDLGSTNGITINTIPHMRQHILHDGDTFTIGRYDFYFHRR